jgi:hypothetical protein
MAADKNEKATTHVSGYMTCKSKVDFDGSRIIRTLALANEQLEFPPDRLA